MDRQVKVLTLGHVNRGTGRVAPFDVIYKGERVCRTEADFDHIDALVIWGGADISPTIYKQPVHERCGAGAELSVGDRIEVAACEAAMARGIPIIGVCRGAQLVCALAGGILVQDVQNHGGNHRITTKDGRSIVTSSVHHQMMYPFKMEKDEYDLIAWADQPRSNQYHGVKVAPEVEPEIVFFPKIKALGIQGHPEFMSPDHEFVTYCNDLVREYLVP